MRGAAAADRQTHDPFGDRMPDHSVVHRYARCNSYPEWGVGTVSGIYFTGDGDDVQQWARVKFAPGVRTVPPARCSSSTSPSRIRRTTASNGS